MTTELTQLAEQSFANLSTSGALQKLIDEQVGKLVKETLSTAMGYNSPFKKALEDYVKASLPFDFSGLGLGGYSAEIIKVIKLKLDASLMEWVDKSIAETMGELLSPPPESITLSELIRQIRQQAKSSALSDEKLTIEIKGSESGSLCKNWAEPSKPNAIVDGYWSIEAKFGYNGYRIAVDKEGKIYSVTVPYQGDITKRVFTCKHSDFETSMWRLYAGGTKIIRDVSSAYDVDYDDGIDD